MEKYHKIENLHKLNKETKCRMTEYTLIEYAYLADCQWDFDEKINGTSMRVIFDKNGSFEVKGRTDKADLPLDLIDNTVMLMEEVNLRNITLYGEGVGPGVHKGSGKYAVDPTFVLFDAHNDLDDYYVDRETVSYVSMMNHIPMVPYVFTGTLKEAYQTVQKGCKSIFGDFWAEGLVGRPIVPVRSIRGNRMIVKIKHRDYYGKELL